MTELIHESMLGFINMIPKKVKATKVKTCCTFYNKTYFLFNKFEKNIYLHYITKLR